MNVHANAATRARRKQTKRGAVHKHNFAGAKLFARLNGLTSNTENGRIERKQFLARAGLSSLPHPGATMIGKIEAALKEKGIALPSRAELVEMLKGAFRGKTAKLEFPSHSGEGKTVVVPAA